MPPAAPPRSRSGALSAPSSAALAALRASGRFDPDWYRQTYPDVDRLGLDPAVHYLIYGHRLNRDPGPGFSTRFARHAYRIPDGHEPLAWLLDRSGAAGPDPRRVLAAAHQVALAGDHARAIALATAHQPPDRAQGVHVLRANAAIARGDAAAWLDHLNTYLAHFGLAPLALHDGATIFDRLSAPVLPPVTGGPLISVIMPAWNAAATVRQAARSILEQTWRNLELLIVDDASTDGTWAVLKDIAACDDRVRVARNQVNVGPYVSKNLILCQARGDWVTGLDSDDWAFPQRLARQAAALQAGPAGGACLFGSLRMSPAGDFPEIRPVTPGRADGLVIPHAITAIFDRRFALDRLGGWDCVRFGADTEFNRRLAFLLQAALVTVLEPCMIYMDRPGSLTNDPLTAFNQALGMSPLRAAYRAAWQDRHRAGLSPVMVRRPFPPTAPGYDLPEGIEVGLNDIARVADMRFGNSASSSSLGQPCIAVRSTQCRPTGKRSMNAMREAEKR